MDDALQAEWEPEIGQHVFRNLDEELKILNESSLAYGVWDWRPGNMKYYWGNRNELRNVYKMTLEQYKAFDPTVVSEKLMKHMNVIAETVQVRQQPLTQSKTLYFGGVPTTIVTLFRPLRVQLLGGEEQTLILGASSPKLDSGLSDEGKQARLATEIMMYIPILISIFSGEQDQWQNVYENPAARNFYKDSADRSSWRLESMLKTCVFKSAAEEQDVLARIKATGLQDPGWEFECRKQQPDGDSVLWHRVSIIPSMNPITSTYSVVVQEYDITPLKLVQSDLQAEQRAQDFFFASISHELRSPLNGIIGLASSLHADRSCSAATKKVLSVIQTSGQRLVGLVNDILDAASCKRGALVVKQEAVDLAKVVQDVNSVLEPLVRRSVTLSHSIPTPFPALLGDSSRLTQILTNLVSNSIKFTAKGHIQVRARLQEGGSGMALVEISDTGEGIPQDKLEQVWEGFQQADVKTAQRHGGTGLGLALVKSLVEAHGGTVSVTSSQASGTSGSCFSFTVPLFSPSRPSSPGSRRAPALFPNGSPQSSRHSSVVPSHASPELYDAGTAPQANPEPREAEGTGPEERAADCGGEGHGRREGRGGAGREAELEAKVLALERELQEGARKTAEMERALEDARQRARGMEGRVRSLQAQLRELEERLREGGEAGGAPSRTQSAAGRAAGGAREGGMVVDMATWNQERQRKRADAVRAAEWERVASGGGAQGGGERAGREAMLSMVSTRRACSDGAISGDGAAHPPPTLLEAADTAWAAEDSGGGIARTRSEGAGESELGRGAGTGAERVVWRRLLEREALAREGAERRARLSDAMAQRNRSATLSLFASLSLAPDAVRD